MNKYTILCISVLTLNLPITTHTILAYREPLELSDILVFCYINSRAIIEKIIKLLHLKQNEPIFQFKQKKSIIYLVYIS